jgi:hypothetical protein
MSSSVTDYCTSANGRSSRCPIGATAIPSPQHSVAFAPTSVRLSGSRRAAGMGHHLGAFEPAEQPPQPTAEKNVRAPCRFGRRSLDALVNPESRNRAMTKLILNVSSRLLAIAQTLAALCSLVILAGAAAFTAATLGAVSALLPVVTGVPTLRLSRAFEPPILKTRFMGDSTSRSSSPATRCAC